MHNGLIKRVPTSQEEKLVSIVNNDTRFEKYSDHLHNQGYKKLQLELFKILDNETAKNYVLLAHFQQNNMIASVTGLVTREEVEKVQCAIDVQEAGTILETRLLKIKNGAVNLNRKILKTSTGSSQSSRKCNICRKAAVVIPQLGTVTVAAVCAVVGAQIAGHSGAASGAICQQIAQKVINYTSKNTNPDPKSICRSLGYCP